MLNVFWYSRALSRKEELCFVFVLVCIRPGSAKKHYKDQFISVPIEKTELGQSLRNHKMDQRGVFGSAFCDPIIIKLRPQMLQNGA